MSTTAANSVTYRKIEPSKLGFFDLPAEVREKIYLHYFPRSGDIYIHLMNDTTQSDDKSDWTKQKARLSCKHSTHLPSKRIDESGVLRPGDDVHNATDTLQRQYRSVADMLADPPVSGLVWSNLEAAARTMFKEASRYSYRHDEFKIIKNWRGTLPQYHENLAAVPKQLLSKIQRLSIRSGYSVESYASLDNFWTSHIWTYVLAQMTSLREVCIGLYSLRAICHHLQSLLTTKAWFMGSKPNVCLDIDVHTLLDDQFQRIHKGKRNALPADNMPPRIIIPPVQKLTLRSATMFCPITTSFFASLTDPADAALWNGATFTHVSSTPSSMDYPWHRIVQETYQMEWPESAPAIANPNGTAEFCRMLESRTNTRFVV